MGDWVGGRGTCSSFNFLLGELDYQKTRFESKFSLFCSLYSGIPLGRVEVEVEADGDGARRGSDLEVKINT